MVIILGAFKKKKIYTLFKCSIVGVLVMIISRIVVYANPEALELLLLYDHYLVQGNVFWAILRLQAWGVIWLLYFGINFFSGSVLDVISLGNFFEDSSFQAIFSLFEEFQFFLLLMSLCTLFMMMIFGRKVELSKAVANLMLCMAIVMALPEFVSTSLNLVQDYSSALSMGTDDELSIGQRTILNNVTDLAVFAYHGWPDPASIPIGERNHLPHARFVRINQQITNPRDFGGSGVLGYHLDFIDREVVAVDFDPDIGFGMRRFQELLGVGYYRYHVNFLTIIAILAALNFVYIYSGVRMGKLMIELSFNQAFASMMAFSDFRTMNRLKSILFRIVASLCTIVGIIASFALFSAFMSFIVNSGLSGASYLFAMLGAMWFVMEGPTIIQQVLGVDAGVQSTFGALGGLMGLKMTSRKIREGIDVGKRIREGLSNITKDIGTERNSNNASPGINEMMDNKKKTAPNSINDGKGKEDKEALNSQSSGINEMMDNKKTAPESLNTKSQPSGFSEKMNDERKNHANEVAKHFGSNDNDLNDQQDREDYAQMMNELNEIPNRINDFSGSRGSDISEFASEKDEGYSPNHFNQSLDRSKKKHVESEKELTELLEADFLGGNLNEEKL